MAHVHIHGSRGLVRSDPNPRFSTGFGFPALTHYKPCRFRGLRRGEHRVRFPNGGNDSCACPSRIVAEPEEIPRWGPEQATAKTQRELKSQWSNHQRNTVQRLKRIYFERTNRFFINTKHRVSGLDAHECRSQALAPWFQSC